MKAIFQTGYGSPDFFALVETNKPEIKDHEVLVKVLAAALHAGDVYFMRGVPKMVRLMAGIPRPKKYTPGFDVAGLVEEVGKKVTEFQPGDEVFGSGQNTCAEYARIKEKDLLLKPVNLTLEQAAAIHQFLKYPLEKRLFQCLLKHKQPHHPNEMVLLAYLK